MTEFKGTKGKWQYTFHESKDRTHEVRRIDSEDGVAICVIRTNNEQQARANAKLISKAPEMLEMLEMWCIDMEERGRAYGDCYTMTKQLIKEATEL